MRQTERKTEGEGREREADGETETEKSHQGNKWVCVQASIFGKNLITGLKGEKCTLGIKQH